MPKESSTFDVQIKVRVTSTMKSELMAIAKRKRLTLSLAQIVRIAIDQFIETHQKGKSVEL